MKVKDNVDLLSLFLFSIFSTHILACIWCYLGRMDMHQEFENRKSWVYAINVDDHDSATIYITSLYYILQTITTVGYGDYTGSTRYEYLFAMVLEVLIHYYNFNVVYRLDFLLFLNGKYQ